MSICLQPLKKLNGVFMPRQTLMQNKNQHLAKNQYSKTDDLNIDFSYEFNKAIFRK